MSASTSPRRRRGIALLLATVVTLSAITAPVAAIPFVSDSFGTDVPVVEYTIGGTPHPSVVVHYETDSLSSLQTWVNQSENRRLVDTHENYNMAVVAAPNWQTLDVGRLGTARAVATGDLGALTSNALHTYSWTEAVRPNYRIEINQPQPLDRDQFTAPTVGTLRIDDPEHPLEGMAFSDDVNQSDIDQARTSVDADSASGTGSGYTVAVIDSGANTADGRIFGNGTANSPIRITNASRNMITETSVNTSADNYTAIEDGTDSRHGTWVASAIAANVSGTTWDGLAPDANLTVYKALGDDGSGSVADIARAIRHATDQEVDAIAMSLGSPVYSEELEDAVTYAVENGTVVFIAAGNSRPKRAANIGSPADVPVDGAITVGAVTANDSDQARSAYFSQVGPDPGTEDDSGGASAGEGVDVAAPGFKVTAKVADEGGFVQNKTLSGTSMAQPFAPGAYVAAASANSTLAGLAPAAVREEMQASAEPIPNASTVEVGAGMVDVDNLENGGYPDADQADNMTAAAEQRTAFYETESDASGGILARIAT